MNPHPWPIAIIQIIPPISRNQLISSMDIQNQYRKRIILKTIAGDYDLEWCRWRVLGSNPKKKKEIFNPNPKGYIHGSVILKNTIYAFFGPDESKPAASMHSYNFKTNEWKQWRDCNLPEARDSFGLAVHKNEIFMFGGSSYDTQYGGLNAFNTMTSIWKTIESSSTPSPRNPLVFTDINNQFIFLYGGINLQTGRIYNDAYIYVNEEWVKVQRILNAPKNLIGAKFALCNQKPYLFGGQFEDQLGAIVANKNLYQILINWEEKTVQFVVISKNQSNAPCPRTSHAMVGVGNEYLILIGGQSILKNKMLRDVWIFDLEGAAWMKIDPVNGPIRPLSDNSIVLHNNSIFILGGLTEHQNMWNEQILALEFGESEPYRSQICTNCIQRSIYKEKQEKSFPKTVVLSSGFFYTISLEIKHPFQAIQILYDCSVYLKANEFHISVEKSLNDNEHIQIEFDGQTLSKQEFQELICHSNTFDQQFSKFMTSLKVACLRLGKTLIFITSDSVERKVFMFSADSKVTPAFDEGYGFYGYVENIKKGTIESHEGKSHKELILNVLRSRVANPEASLNAVSLNRILIFEKNILVTSDKVYYYELISANNDINIYKSAKKLQFLDEIGYEMFKEPEISLKSYLSLARLNFSGLPEIFISKREGAVHCLNYLSVLKSLESQGQIVTFEMPSKIHDIEIQCVLYIAENEKVISDNYGVLIYQDERLINRMTDNFGELFKEEFYKTKFKKSTTIFEFLGVINIKKGLNVNYFGSWFKKNRNYYLFIESLRAAMRKAKLEKMERRLKVEVEGNDEAKLKKGRA